MDLFTPSCNFTGGGDIAISFDELDEEPPGIWGSRTNSKPAYCGQGVNMNSARMFHLSNEEDWINIVTHPWVSQLH